MSTATPRDSEPHTVFVYLQPSERVALRHFVLGRARPEAIPESVWIAWRRGAAAVVHPRNMGALEDAFAGAIEHLRRAAHGEPIL